MQKMPCKKKKYNSRFPPARIKKIMQSDDEVGKVAAVVPIIISRVLEIFVENLLKDSCQITRQRNARTLTPSHIKASILQSNQLDFLKEIVSIIPDIQTTSGDDEQIDFNHQTHSNYADYYPSQNNSNHHKFIKQFSHPATSPIKSSNVKADTLSGSVAINNLGMSNLDLNSLNNKPVSAASTFLSNSKSGNKRFKNNYSRSNSAPCTSTPQDEHLIDTDQLRDRKKINRLKRTEESTNYEDEEYEIDESLSDDSNENQTATLKSTITTINEPASTTTTVTTDSKPNSGTVNKLEMEDDDYDA